MNPTPPPVFSAFIPMFIVIVVALLLSIYLINKKGKSMWLLLIAVIPFVNSFLVIYLLAQTNKDVLLEIQQLKAQLAKQSESSS